MLLKISLALAILVGLGTLYVTHMQVAPKIEEIKAAQATAETNAKTAQEAESKAKAESKKAKAELDLANSGLTDASNRLTQVTLRANQQQQRADTHEKNLRTAVENLDRATFELNQWRAVGMPPDKVVEELVAKQKLIGERDALAGENQIIAQNNDRLKRRLRAYEPEALPPELPPGTSGKVVAVDPKYDFIVLNIGSNQRVVPDANMLVNRAGKLIAKVKITAVEPNRSIANIMPEWKQDEVQEGDQVVTTQ